MSPDPQVIDVDPVEHSSTRLTPDEVRSKYIRDAQKAAGQGAEGHGHGAGSRLGHRLSGIALIVVGVVLVLVGVPMLILPGPGLLSIAVGAGMVAAGARRLAGKRS